VGCHFYLSAVFCQFSCDHSYYVFPVQSPSTVSYYFLISFPDWLSSCTGIYTLPWTLFMDANLIYHCIPSCSSYWQDGEETDFQPSHMYPSIGNMQGDYSRACLSSLGLSGRRGTNFVQHFLHVIWSSAQSASP
jgi:hypothetical protein